MDKKIEFAETKGKKNKKKYVKPTLEVIDLRPEERIAKSSHVNCRACQGASWCAPGGNPGGGQ